MFWIHCMHTCRALMRLQSALKTRRSYRHPCTLSKLELFHVVIYVGHGEKQLTFGGHHLLSEDICGYFIWSTSVMHYHSSPLDCVQRDVILLQLHDVLGLWVLGTACICWVPIHVTLSLQLGAFVHQDDLVSSSTRCSHPSASGTISICSVESVVSFILSNGSLTHAHMQIKISSESVFRKNYWLFPMHPALTDDPRRHSNSCQQLVCLAGCAHCVVNPWLQHVF